MTEEQTIPASEQVVDTVAQPVQEQPQQVNYFLISEAQINEILGNLGAMPYKDVFTSINVLSKLQRVEVKFGNKEEQN